MIHVQCAKKADYHMKHSPNTECFEIYCHMHRPFQLDVDENRSLWDRIDSIGQFVE